MPRHRGDRLDSHQFADIGGKAAIKSRKASNRGPSWHPFLRILAQTDGRQCSARPRCPKTKQRITAALDCFERTTALVKALVFLGPGEERLEERPRPTIAPQTEASVKISKALVPEYRRPSSSDQFEQGAGSLFSPWKPEDACLHSAIGGVRADIAVYSNCRTCHVRLCRLIHLHCEFSGADQSWRRPV
jgi:hypothetical protein